MLESDLYVPVKDWLENRGYLPRGEVKGIDVVALKGETMLAIELKTTLNLEVILQAVDRQRMADIVYIAVPKKGKVLFTKRWEMLVHLLKRLELGLLLVSFKGNMSYVEEAIEPIPFDRVLSRAKMKKRKENVLSEFNKRHGSPNMGGVNKTKIITAYRETALTIAYHLNINGPLSTKKLRELGTGPKTSVILNRNFYQWFKSETKGIYSLTSEGENAIIQYGEFLNVLKETGVIYESK